jgi:hypothetical protein
MSDINQPRVEVLDNGVIPRRGVAFTPSEELSGQIRQEACDRLRDILDHLAENELDISDLEFSDLVQLRDRLTHATDFANIAIATTAAPHDDEDGRA